MASAAEARERPEGYLLLRLMTSCRALTGAPPRPTGAAVHVHVHVHNRSSCNCEVGLGQSDLTTDREDPAAAPASPARHRTQCTGKPWGAHTPGHVIGWEHHATDVGADQADDARQAPLGRRKARNQGTDSLLSNQRSPRSHVHACQRRYRKGLPSYSRWPRVAPSWARPHSW